GVLGAGTVLGAARLGYAGVMADLVVLGFFAGFIAVPINAIMQHRPRAARSGAGVAEFSELLRHRGRFGRVYPAAPRARHARNVSGAGRDHAAGNRLGALPAAGGLL